MHEHARSGAMPASEVVFGTFELLEAILFDLPMQTLLLSQRVNKQWKSVIEGSTKLQQALFFKPIPGDPIPFTELSTQCREDSATYKKVEALSTGKCTLVEEAESGVTLQESLLKSTDLGDAKYIPSWAKMIPTQPPIDKCFYLDCYYKDSNLEEHIAELHFDHGHTMRDIVEGLDSKMQEYADELDREFKSRLAAAFIFSDELQDNYQLSHFIRQQKKRKSTVLKDGNLLSWFGRKARKLS